MSKASLDLKPKVRKARSKNLRRDEQPAAQSSHDSGVSAVQNQLGNRVVQRLLAQRNGSGIIQLEPARLQALSSLAQRQASEDEAAAQLSTGKPQGKVTIEDVGFDYYDVSGSSLSEVYSQLDPKEWGHCKYTFEYDYESTNGKTSKVNIILKLTIRLPRWTNIDKASPAARQEWNRMLAALTVHEEKHAKIARKWAPIFKERLFGQAEDLVAAKHASTLAAVDKETDKYDSDSQHGKNEGVSLDQSIQ